MLYQEATRQRDAVIQEMTQTTQANQERLEYLTALNIKLQEVVKNLEADLGKQTGDHIEKRAPASAASPASGSVGDERCASRADGSTRRDIRKSEEFLSTRGAHGLGALPLRVAMRRRGGGDQASGAHEPRHRPVWHVAPDWRFRLTADTRASTAPQ